MALKIRLQRHGTSHRPFYRMVVTEANARRDGRFVELLGTYEPQASRPENELNLKIDRIDYWKSVGAKTTDTAESLLRRARREIDGVIPKAKSKKEKKKVEEAVEEAVAVEEAEEPIVEADESTTETCSISEADSTESEASDASTEDASNES
jgi:small subunit ribosomal protein S16